MSNRGVMLVEVMIVIMLTAILLAIGVPTFVHEREKSWTSSCFKNQVLMDRAKDSWKQESDSASAPNMSDLVPDYVKQTPTCPTNGTYTLGDGSTLVACSLHPREASDPGNDGNGNGKGGN